MCVQGIAAELTGSSLKENCATSTYSASWMKIKWGGDTVKLLKGSENVRFK